MPPADSIAAALTWFKFSADAFQKQREREKEDLKCQTLDGMWPDDIKTARGRSAIGNMVIPARPMISIPTMDEPVQLVLNQQRSAHLGVNIHPLSEDATDDTAEVLQGLYRRSEQESGANNVRSWAYDRSTKCGIGWYRIDKVYDQDGGHPLDQKLIFRRILFQGAVYPDPFAQEPDWSDGLRLMVVNDIPFVTYKRKWPKSDMSSFNDGELTSLGSQAQDWIGGNDEASRTVRVAEDWRVEIQQRKWVLLDNHEMAPEDQIPPERQALTGKDARWKYEEQRRVFWRVINCQEELEPEQEWDGHYIPFVPTIGRELQPFDGKRIWYGMYSTAKDGARLTNYAASSAVEMAALEPKAPWQGEEGSFEGHELEYQQANYKAIPYLQYKGKNLMGERVEAPKRVQVDVSRLGPSMQLLTLGRDFVQTAMSTFDPALGKQPTAHRSGRAIIALQDQTVEGTSHYFQNLADISMMHEARVWLDLAPHVYDRPGRIARILDEHDESKTVMLNQAHQMNPVTQRPQSVNLPPGMSAPDVAANDQNPVKHYDLTKGRYGVSITIGKSSASRLQEGETEMGQILQAAPELMPVIGPIYFKFRDFPGARQVADLLKKDRDHRMPWLSDDPQQDPAAKLAEAEQVMQHMKQALDQLQKEKDAKIVEMESKFKIAEMQESSESQRAAADREVKLAVAELSAKIERLTLFTEERARLGIQAHESATAAADAATNQHMAELGHDQETQQALLSHQGDVNLAEQAQSHALDTMAVTPQEPPASE